MTYAGWRGEPSHGMSVPVSACGTWTDAGSSSTATGRASASIAAIRSGG